MLKQSTNGLNVWVFLSLTALLSLTSCWVAYRCSSELSVKVILAWAVLFRLIALFFGPVYEDDFYRYLWDGYRFFQQGTPYGIPPSNYFGNEGISEQFQLILDHINYPDIATIYGPLLQYSFLLVHLITPGEVIGLQVLYTLSDIILLFLLARICQPQGLLLYAWCPLVVKEIAFTAHPDGVGVLLLIASVLALHHGHQRSALALIALSVCTKVFALLVVPFILIRCNWRHIWIFFAVIGGLYFPFILQGGSDLLGLSSFVQNWQFNASLYGLLAMWMPPATAKFTGIVLFILFYFIYGIYFYNQRHSSILSLRGDWIFAVFFIIAPVMNAWYSLWLLAFAAMHPSRWAWVASWALLLSYVTGLTLESSELSLYEQPSLTHGFEYALIACAAIVDFYFRVQRRSLKTQ